MNNTKYRLIFFGSSHHSLPALEALAKDGRYEIVGVVSQPDKPVGRKQVITPTPVSKWAIEHKVELLIPNSWKKDTAVMERVKELRPDVGVLAIYGKILPQNLLDLFPKGIINIHPSLLPKYRGPAPAPFVILNDDKVSGVAIMLLVAEMDAGPILKMVKFDVSPTETPETYYEKGFTLGAKVLVEVLPEYLENKIVPFEQKHEEATYSHMLSRNDGKIDWNKSVPEIERMVRAFTPWPGTWTEVWMDGDGKILLEREMAERTGIPFKDGDWDGVYRKRMKILSVSIQVDVLVLEQVQIEGEQVIQFSVDLLG